MVNDVVPSTLGFSNSLIDDRPSSVKFGLYIKTREIEQLEESLKQVILLPKIERNDWVEEHEAFMNELMESFMNDSTLALDGLQLDKEATELSIRFVSKLRDVMNTIRGILDEAQSLNS